MFGRVSEQKNQVTEQNFPTLTPVNFFCPPEVIQKKILLTMMCNKAGKRDSIPLFGCIAKDAR
jgi:hypothetical protein